MEEIWKQISGYEGRYEVSNLGKVRSYAQNKKGKFVSGSLSKKGYIMVKLYDSNGVNKTYPVHRLVAKAFIPNPKNLPQVNHKDENKENNSIENLEWCTNDYNIHYGTKIARTTAKLRCCPSTSKKIFSIDSNGMKKFYNSIGEAARQTGLIHPNIIKVLKGERHTCGGLNWCYAE